MQTRRDQLHAYRFLTKRALAALVTGEPNAVEPPMRRLTLTTVSGVMIAVLVGVGFAVFGLIKPTAGDSWKAQGVVIIENETGAHYIYRAGKLDPVLNYSSAVLAVSSSGGTSKVGIVNVDRDEIADVPRGPMIGIDGVPESLPDPSKIVDAPWIVCSRNSQLSATQLKASVSVTVGDDVLAPTALPSGQAVLVTTPTAGGIDYLLWDGLRYRIDTATVKSALEIGNAAVLTVGTAFLQSIDAGPDLTAPAIADRGKPGPDIDGTPTQVGELINADSSDQTSVVFADGLLPLNALQAALLRITAPAEKTLSGSAIVNAGLSKTTGPALLATSFGSLPKTLPVLASAPNDQGNVCASFGATATATPTFEVVRSELPGFHISAVIESDRSRGGTADSVAVSPGHAALVRSGDKSPTIFAVAEPGKKYAFSNPGLITAFGYGGVTPATLPGQLLPLVPPGPALDPTAALTPVTS